LHNEDKARLSADDAKKSSEARAASQLSAKKSSEASAKQKPASKARSKLNVSD